MACIDCIKSGGLPKDIPPRPEIDPGEKCGYLRLRFLDRMQAELEANAKKGDWDALNYSPEQAHFEATTHLAKLFHALRVGDADKVSEHCADIAVIAMKVSEHHGNA